ncbi:MAG: hypothetical protein ACQCN5_10140 [Candidatus Bathyarchaeia archaeon]|jgi:hypothetical protein
MSDKHVEALRRQQLLQNQLEQQMSHQETQRHREEHIKNQMDWLIKVEQ